MLRASALFFDADARIPCTVSPCKPWDDVVAQALSGPELKVFCYWCVAHVRCVARVVDHIGTWWWFCGRFFARVCLRLCCCRCRC